MAHRGHDIWPLESSFPLSFFSLPSPWLEHAFFPFSLQLTARGQRNFGKAPPQPSPLPARLYPSPSLFLFISPSFFLIDLYLSILLQAHSITVIHDGHGELSRTRWQE